MRVPRFARSAVVAVTATAAVVAGSALAVSAFAQDKAVTTDDTALVARLDQLLAGPGLDGTTTGVVVRDGTGRLIYSHNPDQRVIPASNEKIMTSVAAAEVLGTSYRFHTRVLSTGTRSGATLRGDLYLKGYGDPTTTAAQYDALAKAVAAAGIRSVTGALVADDTWFDATRLGTDWAWNDEAYADSAPVSALTVAADNDFNAGSVVVHVRPGAAVGRPGVVTVVPANSGVTVVNNTGTARAGTAETIGATRRYGTGTIVVSGTVGLAGAQTTDRVSVQDPTRAAASVFRAALAAHGVKVAKPTTTKAAPSGARTLADRASITLGQLFTPFLKLSNNGHAEVLVKAMGRQVSGGGTWPAGIAAARAALAKLGVATGQLMLVDGSGLTRRDWLTAGQLDRLLVAAQGRAWFPTWKKALPLAGNPDRLVGGTLASRFTGTRAANNLQAKTGTLTGVNALSGYVTDASGRLLVFSAVVNNALADAAPVLDQLGVDLATAGGAGTLVAPRTAPRVATPTRDGAAVECSWVDAC
jgi:serine-type D-Ala-D-Ala carboxypeptidase/endopeptidase (penicillin-binding protein 4)